MDRAEYTYAPNVPIDEDFLCPICRNPLWDPVEHPNCGNMFCESCLKEAMKTSNKCPLCRIEIGTLHKVTTKAVLNKLSSFLVVCPSCHHNFARDVLPSHIPRCPVACPHDCGQLVAPISLTEHLKTSCASVLVSCPAADSFCEWRGSRPSLKAHVETCLYLKLRPAFLSLQNRILKLEAENTKLKEDVATATATAAAAATPTATHAHTATVTHTAIHTATATHTATTAAKATATAAATASAPAMTTMGGGGVPRPLLCYRCGSTATIFKSYPRRNEARDDEFVYQGTTYGVCSRDSDYTIL
ncbi:Q8IVH4 Methylmalonic aciduria type A protein [Pelomyxa schiedti]|nr:Q8IVH4 Methylmalonic aciduria type A protein [Pelomyxa schiedti]